MIAMPNVLAPVSQPSLEIFRCPECGRRVMDADLKPGSTARVTCKRCGATVTVRR
jgi:hypothetical protein